LLEVLFRGFIEWAYGLTWECWEYFSDTAIDLMSMDFEYLRTHIPIIDTIRQGVLAVGWALLIGNLVFQASKSMLSGLGFEGEDPKLLFTRTFVFSFLLFASPQICEVCLKMTSSVLEVMKIPDAVDIKFADEASFCGLAASWLLVIICGIIVMFKSFGLFFEMAERYFILAVLTICAPLAFGVGGSRNTSDIFSGWCRMYGSMCLLMILNVMFVKILLSILSFYPMGIDVLPWLVMVFATIKVAKKADSIVMRIGLNPALTGDSLGRGFPGRLTYTIARSIVSQVAKNVGRGGENGSGRNSAAPPNAPQSPKTGGAGRGKGSAGAYSFVNNSSAKNTQNQNSKIQGSMTNDADTMTANAANEYFEKPKVGTGVSANSSGFEHGNVMNAGKVDRKSFVPLGMKRAPGYTQHMSQSNSQSAMRATNTERGKAADINPMNSVPNFPDAIQKPVKYSVTTHSIRKTEPNVVGIKSVAGDFKNGTGRNVHKENTAHEHGYKTASADATAPQIIESYSTQMPDLKGAHDKDGANGILMQSRNTMRGSGTAETKYRPNTVQTANIKEAGNFMQSVAKHGDNTLTRGSMAQQERHRQVISAYTPNEGDTYRKRDESAGTYIGETGKRPAVTKDISIKDNMKPRPRTDTSSKAPGNTRLSSAQREDKRGGIEHDRQR